MKIQVFSVTENSNIRLSTTAISLGRMGTRVL